MATEMLKRILIYGAVGLLLGFIYSFGYYRGEQHIIRKIDAILDQLHDSTEHPAADPTGRTL